MGAGKMATLSGVTLSPLVVFKYEVCEVTRVYHFSYSLEWEPPSYCSVPLQCHASTMLLGDTHPILLIISVVMRAQ